MSDRPARGAPSESDGSAQPVDDVGPRLRGPLLIAAVVVVLDQLTKHWALNRSATVSTIDVIWTLRFNLAFNSGMAFSQGPASGPSSASSHCSSSSVCCLDRPLDGSRIYPSRSA